MPKKLSQEHVDSDDDSSSSPKPKAKPASSSKGKKRQKGESQPDDEEKIFEAEGDESDSSGAPNKKQKKGPSKPQARRNDQNDPYFELSDNKRVTISKFKGNVRVDIRETYSKDGKAGLPGKKGINLDVEQFKRLKEYMNAIEEAIEEYS